MRWGHGRLAFTARIRTQMESRNHQFLLPSLPLWCALTSTCPQTTAHIPLRSTYTRRRSLSPGCPGTPERPWPDSGACCRSPWCSASCKVPSASSPASGRTPPWDRCEDAAEPGPAWCTRSPAEGRHHFYSTFLLKLTNLLKFSHIKSLKKDFLDKYMKKCAKMYKKF